MTLSLQDRYRGSLVGLATGDALGGPREAVRKHEAEAIPYVSEMVGGGWLKLLPGQITDDTEMALCIARSIVERQTFDPADVAARFLAWHKDNPIGMGRATRYAMRRLEEGLPWNEAGYSDVGKNGLGNGSVMRCAPVALLDRRRSSALLAHTFEQGSITHPHPDCQESCVFLNTMIAALLNGREKKNAIGDGLVEISARVPLAYRYRMIPLLPALGTSGIVYETIESAVATFLRNNTFEATLLDAVNLGGDADTRGAVVGALAGAHYGIAAIPERWTAPLCDRHGEPVLQELLDIATGLYKLS